MIPRNAVTFDLHFSFVATLPSIRAILVKSTGKNLKSQNKRSRKAGLSFKAVPTFIAICPHPLTPFSNLTLYLLFIPSQRNTSEFTFQYGLRRQLFHCAVATKPRHRFTKNNIDRYRAQLECENLQNHSGRE